jgi:recombinational DNA repair protein (RecF pathway)
MAYHIYTTKALVLRRIPYEGNVTYLLYTRELGLIFASATGVRKSESKLRYALQEYGVCTVSVVKGKHVWRITSAIPEYNIYLHAIEQKSKSIVAHVCSVISRLIQGQEKDEQLYDTCVAGLEHIICTEGSKVELIEIIVLIRILSLLGYVSVQTYPHILAPYTTYDEDLYAYVDKQRIQLVAVINKGLQESHL